MKCIGFLFLFFTACACSAECLIIAHRGASNRAPENTVEAVKLAWELGADAVEVDLQASKDGVIVIYHDKDTERVGGRRGLVKNQTYAQLLQLDAGIHKGSEFKGVKIPRLEEILAAVPAGKSIFLELKAGKELMAPLSTILATTRLDPVQLKIIGFDLEQMKTAKTLFPHLTVYWLVEISTYIPQDRWSEEITNTVAAAKSAGVDGLCVGGNPVANTYFISQAKAANLKFFVYTIDDGSKARRFAGMGVDGIITNRPDYIRESL